jgi:hypothetical protein
MQNKEKRHQYYLEHKERLNKLSKEYYLLHKTELKIHDKKYREQHKDKRHQWYKENEAHIQEYNQANKDKKLAYGKLYRFTHRESLNQKARAYYYSHLKEGVIVESLYKLKVKTNVMTHYGNGKCACVRCGFDDIRALSIDHINGKGNKQRKETGKNGGGSGYIWLIKNNYPEGYQTLCMNCQFIKSIEEKECRWRYAQSDNKTSLVEVSI